MNNKIKSIYLIAISIFLIGCSTTANLYPIKGPLSMQKPIPIIKAKINGILGNTGSISLTLPTGEECKGKWSSAAGVSAGYGTVNLFSQYGSMLGTGLSIQNKAGVNRGEAIMVGDRDTVIEIEFYTGSGTANGYGLAKDNQGNIYKVLF